MSICLCCNQICGLKAVQHEIKNCQLSFLHLVYPYVPMPQLSLQKCLGRNPGRVRRISRQCTSRLAKSRAWNRSATIAAWEECAFSPKWPHRGWQKTMKSYHFFNTKLHPQKLLNRFCSPKKNHQKKRYLKKWCCYLWNRLSSRAQECYRLLPNFGLWVPEIHDWTTDGPINPSRFFHPSPSCCRWSSKASLYLQASSPSCRTFFPKIRGWKERSFEKYIRYTIVGRLQKKTRKK